MSWLLPGVKVYCDTDTKATYDRCESVMGAKLLVDGVGVADEMSLSLPTSTLHRSTAEESSPQ